MPDPMAMLLGQKAALLRQLATARSSPYPVSPTPCAIRLHAPRRYQYEPNGITQSPSPPCAARSRHTWHAPYRDVPAASEAIY